MHFCKYSLTHTLVTNKICKKYYCKFSVVWCQRWCYELRNRFEIEKKNHIMYKNMKNAY